MDEDFNGTQIVYEMQGERYLGYVDGVDNDKICVRTPDGHMVSIGWNMLIRTTGFIARGSGGVGFVRV